jgi:hypothetical protein
MAFDRTAKKVRGNFIISGTVGGRQNRTLGPFGWKEKFLVLTDESKHTTCITLTS